MKKNLSLLGIILFTMALFSGCQKNDDNISLNVTEESLAQQIDYVQAQQILDSELAKLQVSEINSDVELKSTVEYSCSLFRVVLDYDDDPCVPLVYFDDYSKKAIDDSNTKVKFLAQAWFYKNAAWTLKSTMLLGGEISIGEKLGHWYLTYYDYEWVAAQVLIYKYIDGQQPVFTGISEGVGFTLRTAPVCQ